MLKNELIGEGRPFHVPQDLGEFVADVLTGAKRTTSGMKMDMGLRQYHTS